MVSKSSIIEHRKSLSNSSTESPIKPQTQSIPTVNPPSNATPTVSSAYYQERVLEGIVPLFLTGQSQALVKCVIGEDVTNERMFRMIPKADLMQDMATRLAISDFTPAKALILAYPREELMLHYDPEYKYTQNFFLVTSPETVDSILMVQFANQPPTDEPVNADAEKETKTRQRGWVSLGSEKEVESEWIKSQSELTLVELSRKYSDFKQPCNFGDRDAFDAYLDLKSYKDPNYDLIRLETQIGVQAIPEIQSTQTQTSWFRSLNFGCQYEALEMDPAEQDEIQHSESLEMFMLNISPRYSKLKETRTIPSTKRNHGYFPE